MPGHTVLVTGVRGKTGRAVAEQLTAHARVTVRGGSADPARVRAAGVVPVAFDWARQGTWADALSGVDAVYLMRPDIEDAPERVAELVDAAPGAARIVLLSEMGAEDLAADTWVSRVERAATAGAHAWTILRPSWFQQVLSDERFFRGEITDGASITLPSRGAGISWVDARDIAAVAVEALIAPGHDGAAYALSGPAALDLTEVADLLSSATGRRVRAVDPPAADRLAGLEPWLAIVVGDMYERVAAGAFAGLSDDVLRTTGRPPRSMEAFIAEHASVWRPT
jgi:uncharacterized protein YbjT (DUF2867 family)